MRGTAAMNRSRFDERHPGIGAPRQDGVELDGDPREQLQALRPGAPGQVGQVADAHARGRARPGRPASGGRARGCRGRSETRSEVIHALVLLLPSSGVDSNRSISVGSLVLWRRTGLPCHIPIRPESALNPGTLGMHRIALDCNILAAHHPTNRQSRPNSGDGRMSLSVHGRGRDRSWAEGVRAHRDGVKTPRDDHG